MVRYTVNYFGHACHVRWLNFFSCIRFISYISLSFYQTPRGEGEGGYCYSWTCDLVFQSSTNRSKHTYVIFDADRIISLPKRLNDLNLNRAVGIFNESTPTCIYIQIWMASLTVYSITTLTRQTSAGWSRAFIACRSLNWKLWSSTTRFPRTRFWYACCHIESSILFCSFFFFYIEFSKTSPSPYFGGQYTLYC